MIKVILKGIILSAACLFFGFLMMRNSLKVKRIEKLCDNLRDDKRLAMGKAMECNRPVLEFDADADTIFNKLKPLCYQVEIGGEHTLFLCRNIDDNSFLLITLYGDTKLIPLNFKIILDKNSNKIKILSEQDEDAVKNELRIDFATRFIKYCKA